MASHTPGKWEVGEARYGAQVMVFSGEREVADCGHNFSDCGNEEDRANARLIAAAPELLAALEHALAEYDLDPELQTVFRAAIKKARGE